MRHARLSFVAIGLLSLACSAGQNADSTSFGPGGSTTSTDDPSESSTGRSTTTGIVDGTGDGESSSSGPPPGTTTSGSSSEGSTGEACPAGSEGCACNAGTCDDDLVCLDDTCQVVCDEDVFEPNDDEATAQDLGEINDNDGNGGVVSGSLHHLGDVDWFRYAGNDDVTGNVDPARELVSSGSVRLCKFLECENGLEETEFECPAGTQYALSPMARPGCCATGDVALPDLNCGGVTEDNAMVYMRVDQPVPACATYSISYHY